MAGTVLVSGGSGYVAGFLIRQLVNDGWMVHTTVRNPAHESEVRKLINVDNARIKFFTADLLSDDGWKEAMAGCSHVAHLASPFPLVEPKNEDDLIIPARDGALRVLRAARSAGVKRFVMTSSCAAISYGHEKNVQKFAENDWSNLSTPGIGPYVKSKTVAERTARNWVAAEGGDMEYCTVNPVGIFGPVWSDDIPSSNEIIKNLLEGTLPGCPDIGFAVVDGRDVADIHVRALNAPGMAGERFICSGPFLKMIDVARILKSKLGAEAKNVPARRLPNIFVRVGAAFNPTFKQFVGQLGKIRNTDASHAREVLGWIPRPPKETIIDTARSLIDLGIAKV